MAVFTLIPFSANEVVYLSKTISSHDLVALTNNQNSYASYGYDDNTNAFISLLGSTSNTNYRISNLPYRSDVHTFYNGIFFDGVVFTNNSSNNRRILVSINFPLDLYFDDIELTFYFLTSSQNYQGVNTFSAYALSNGDLINLSTDLTLIDYDTLNNLSDTGFISQTYYDYVLTNIYYTNYAGDNTYFANGLTLNTNFALYKVVLSVSNLDKTLIDGIFFSYLMNYPINNAVFPRIFPYVFFDSDLEAYILSSQDQVYTDIVNGMADIQQKLDVVTGPPSQQQQAAIDQVENQLATEYDELQEQLDIIHSPEMPTELPTEDFSNLEDEAAVINNYLGDLNLLNIFNVIVPAGCAGFLIYIVLRRF